MPAESDPSKGRSTGAAVTVVEPASLAAHWDSEVRRHSGLPASLVFVSAVAAASLAESLLMGAPVRVKR